MSAMPPTIPRIQFPDANGSPLSGGFVHVYLAGTTTRTTSWQDRAQLTANTNPIELDAAGSCLLRLDPNTACKIVVTDASGVTQSHLGGDNLYGTASLADLTAAVEADMNTAVADAEAAQLAAEIARDTALTTGRLYVDTTAGLAAVASGEHFLVPVTTSDYTELILYLDSAGTAVEKGRWSISYFESVILGQHVYADKNGNVFAYYDHKGELRLNGNARGVDQRLEDARAQAFFAAAIPLGLRCENDTALSDSVEVASELVDDTLGGTAWASEQFKVLEYNTSVQYRFPTLLQLSPGTLLLFACELESPVGIDDIHHARIVVCDVSFNFRTKSFTVSAPREVVSMRAFTSGASKAYAIGHTPLLVRSGTNKGRIYLPFGSNKDAPATLSAEKPYITYSDDNGVTWAASSALTVATGGFDNFGYGTGMKGLQLKFGSNRGRLVFPWYSNTAANFTQCFAVYSDDGGANWTRGTPFGPQNLSEPSFAEHTDGTIYAMCRGGTAAPYFTQLWQSSDGGATFSLVNASYIQSPGCQVSTVQASEMSPNTPKLLMAWPDDTAGNRKDLTVSASYDGWTTKTSKLLDSGNAAYSGIESIGEDYIMVAWEKNYYSGFAADTIVLQAMNIKYITG